MTLKEIGDAWQTIMKLENDERLTEASHGCATARVENGYEIDSVMGMYVGPAVIVTVEAAGRRFEEGGYRRGFAIAGIKGILMAETSKELKRLREQEKKGKKP
ncbi:MAG: hypothetical protein J6Y62_03850 [Clostridia bacterium]|nr:hypothetical protein [Clostridia bacterium]